MAISAVDVLGLPALADMPFDGYRHSRCMPAKQVCKPDTLVSGVTRSGLQTLSVLQQTDCQEQ